MSMTDDTIAPPAEQAESVTADEGEVARLIAEELAQYSAYVARVADAADGEVILNRSIAHAAVIVENLFRKATSRVEILTGELDQRVYGTAGVIAEAIRFVQHNDSARITILSEKAPIKKHPLIDAIGAAGFADRIEVNLVPEDLQKRYQCHFAVADARHLRFEKSRDKLEAIVQFGGTDLGQQLHGLFADFSQAIVPT